MSDSMSDPGPDDSDLFAAEYALGVLEPVEARLAEARAEVDPAFRDSLHQWQHRLAPLAPLIPPAPPPPDLWRRIEAGIDPVPLRVIEGGRKLAVWRGATAASLALAAAFAAIAFLRSPAPHYVAALTPLSGAGGASYLAETRPNGTLAVRAVAAVAVPSGRDLELWALAKGAKIPVPLGVLPASGTEMHVAGLRPDTEIMVSLEPRGGSPTGQPTGPVLLSGKLEE